MAKMIDGEAYKEMILAAAAAVADRVEEVNALNVFPVPDGDTGTNMSMTLNNAAEQLNKLESPTLGRALEVTSSALLRGARGNSGVITSLLFRGIAKGMKDARTADGAVHPAPEIRSAEHWKSSIPWNRQLIVASKASSGSSTS